MEKQVIKHMQEVYKTSYRDVATRGAGGGHAQVSVLNIRNIDFYGCSEIIRTRNFTIFTVYAIIFGQFMAAFHFFLTM